MGSEDLEIVFMPALVQMLHLKESEKGASLTEEEVLNIRDNAVCITLRKSEAYKLSEARGWHDIDPENCWEDWRHLKNSEK